MECGNRLRVGVRAENRENRMGGFRKGGFSNNRFVLKPDVAIASEVSILSKNSLAIKDFHAKKTLHVVQLFENPFLEPPHSRFPKKTLWRVGVGVSAPLRLREAFSETASEKKRRPLVYGGQRISEEKGVLAKGVICKIQFREKLKGNN